MTPEQKEFLKAQKEERRKQQQAHQQYVENLTNTNRQLKLEADYARYQFEKMHFALEADKLIEPYQALQQRERDRMQKMREQQQELLRNLEENNVLTPDQAADLAASVADELPVDTVNEDSIKEEV